MFCFAKQKLLITSDNSVYLVTALPRASTHICLRYATANIRYTDTLCRNRSLPLPALRFGRVARSFSA